MSFLPPGFDLSAELDRHNAVLVELQGQNIIYTPLSGTAIAMRAVPYAGARDEEIDPGNAIRMLARKDDFGAVVPANGDSVEFAGESFVVENSGQNFGQSVELNLRKR